MFLNSCGLAYRGFSNVCRRNVWPYHHVTAQWLPGETYTVNCLQDVGSWLAQSSWCMRYSRGGYRFFFRRKQTDCHLGFKSHSTVLFGPTATHTLACPSGPRGVAISLGDETGCTKISPLQGRSCLQPWKTSQVLFSAWWKAELCIGARWVWYQYLFPLIVLILFQSSIPTTTRVHQAHMGRTGWAGCWNSRRKHLCKGLAGRGKADCQTDGE